MAWHSFSRIVCVVKLQRALAFRKTNIPIPLTWRVYQPTKCIELCERTKTDGVYNSYTQNSIRTHTNYSNNITLRTFHRDCIPNDDMKWVCVCVWVSSERNQSAYTCDRVSGGCVYIHARLFGTFMNFVFFCFNMAKAVFDVGCVWFTALRFSCN